MTETDATPTPAANPKKEHVDATIEENEIRVTAQGKMRNYVAYAATIFSESKSHTVVLKGMGRVINKTVSLAEILKRRVKGLYQLAEIGSIKVIDKKSGKGDEAPTEVVRLLSVIKIILTTEPEDKGKYQLPLDESMVEPMTTTLPKRAKPTKKGKARKSEAKDAAEASDQKKDKAAKAKRLKRKRNRKAKKEAAKESGEAAATPSETKVKSEAAAPSEAKVKSEGETEKKTVAKTEEATAKPSTEASA